MSCVKLREYLSRAECEVKVQEEFSQSPHDTLTKLDLAMESLGWQSLLLTIEGTTGAEVYVGSIGRGLLWSDDL